MKIVLTGATGLVGRQAIEELAAADTVELHALVRNDPGNFPPNCRVHVADPVNWAARIEGISAEVAISCLGTTWKQSGKDQATFRSVDYDLLLAVARAARTSGARQFIAVSSMGADAKSRNFYLRTKGEMEAQLVGLDFDRLDVLRPGLLSGTRNIDRRLGERIAIMISPFTDMLMQGSLRRYRSIPSAKVAQAIVTLALGGGHGRHIHTNDAIRALAG
jgi:uncharacterized protein YbjT (DUF2867 family)